MTKLPQNLLSTWMFGFDNSLFEDILPQSVQECHNLIVVFPAVWQFADIIHVVQTEIFNASAPDEFAK